MKKLIPALALLLVSAVMLGTSSFAWFSMNTEVTATGMSVTAQAPTSLLISNTSATTGFGSSVTLENSNTSAPSTFVPVAYDTVGAKFYALSDKAMSKVNQAGRVISNNFTEVSDGSAASAFTSAAIDAAGDAYVESLCFYHDQIWLKVEGQKNQTVTATAKYTNSPTSAIKGAMHVVFVIGGSVVATCDMGGDTGTGVTTSTLATLTANDDATLVDIYYFLSGNDTDCKNSNITADATLNIDITFNAADVVTP